MPVLPEDSAFDLGDNLPLGFRAPNASEVAIMVASLRLDDVIRIPESSTITGNAYTFTVADEGTRKRFTSPTPVELTLPIFSAKDQFIIIRCETDAGFTTPTLPSGTTFASDEQSVLTNLKNGGELTLTCIDATQGAQIIESI